MEVVLRIKDNLYKEVETLVGDKIFTKKVIIKRNVPSNINIETNDIILITDHVDDRGNIKKNYCGIHLRDVGQITVNHSREYISQLKQPKLKPIGFKQRKLHNQK